ncbi:hypothetical protein FXF50_16060 [Micromonospora sp. AP08]|uniref:hypothetical protein n=1 Tax=Micromonospora sp. AP08 TaxID=2604467 RepID=UPI0011D61838|nr:hypothetical protein [Micromonospora sp. AP08]TYB37148.1 hypothetical protein FXF50_16060 [Micromonospora sp. AP08]
MKDVSIRERVDHFLGGDAVDREDVRFYLSQLLELARGHGKATSAAIARAMALAALFVLLSSARLSEAEIVGVKVQDFSFFLIVIPVAISFLFLRALLVIRAYGEYMQIYHEITRKYVPRWYESDLDEVLMPWQGSLVASPSLSHLDGGEHPLAYKSRRVLQLLELALGLAVPVLFQVYAYTVLFRRPEIPVVVSAVSLAISAVIVTAGVLYIVSVGMEPVRRPANSTPLLNVGQREAPEQKPHTVEKRPPAAHGQSAGN